MTTTAATLDYIVDTDVWSFIFRDDTRAEAYRDLLDGKRIGVSAQTVGELLRGARANHWSSRRIDGMMNALRRFRIVSLTGDTAVIWADVRVKRDRIGQPITAQDAWIAATALREKCALVTHNARHFGEIDHLQVISLSSEDAT
jgi:tRNA(fMet)-specific endonuclease VapC